MQNLAANLQVSLSLMWRVAVAGTIPSSSHRQVTLHRYYEKYPTLVGVAPPFSKIHCCGLPRITPW
jgi:hypothetical protein